MIRVNMLRISVKKKKLRGKVECCEIKMGDAIMYMTCVIKEMNDEFRVWFRL